VYRRGRDGLPASVGRAPAGLRASSSTLRVDPFTIPPSYRLPEDTPLTRESPTPLPITIVRLHAGMRLHTQRVLAEHGALTLSQWRVLRVVGDGIATLSSAVRREAVIDKGQFSRTLDSLEAEGLIATKAAAGDARRTEIRLTRLGRSVHARVAPALDERHRRLLGTMTRQEREQLLTLLARLVDTVEELEGTG